MFNTIPWIPEQVTRQVKINEFIERMRKAPDDRTFSVPAFLMKEEWNCDFKPYPMLDPRKDKLPIMSPRRRMFIYKNASTEWRYHSGDETLTSRIVGAKCVSLFKTNPQNHKLIKKILEGNLHHMNCGSHFLNFNQN